MDKIAIQLTNISKKYVVHHERPTLIDNIFSKKNKGEFWALRNVNFRIPKGEKVGIIGPNGSGKTTLLKIIAGITTPTTGSVITNGKCVSLIELEAGFHPDLTGEENIYLNGLLIGMTTNEIKAKLKRIIDFADIGEFIDTPMYTYSSGMKLRLGFSITVHSDPEILILDEGIGIGDRDFQKKSQDKIQEFFKKGKTILVVTHWLDFIERNCNRVIVMKKGRIAQDGSKSLVAQYRKRLLHP
jgi:ABC-type polysaccharide/polyol phosphate transport system ATPase subunit